MPITKALSAVNITQFVDEAQMQKHKINLYFINKRTIKFRKKFNFNALNVGF